MLTDNNAPSVQILKTDIDITDSGFLHVQEKRPNNQDNDLPNMFIRVLLNGYSVGASLLPSLKVEYKVSA